jgi:uncharacterized integral membrane protein
MKATRTVSIVALCLVAAIILFQNRAPVETHFLMVDVQTPQSILLIAVLLVGVGIGMLASHLMNRKKPETKDGGRLAEKLRNRP